MYVRVLEGVCVGVCKGLCLNILLQECLRPQLLWSLNRSYLFTETGNTSQGSWSEYLLVTLIFIFLFVLWPLSLSFSNLLKALLCIWKNVHSILFNFLVLLLFSGKACRVISSPTSYKWKSPCIFPLTFGKNGLQFALLLIFLDKQHYF